MYEQNIPHGVEAHGLGKRHGDLWALRDLELAVPAGTVLGLLGHNGAGKTTAIRILTTLAAPTTGTARVAGIDVTADPAGVRARIGLTGQSATVDGLLTGRANLEMVGRLYKLGRKGAKARADELLERLDLTDAADRLVKGYSGGMRRRLDLAASMVISPPVLFLDEPTTGLDPRSRNELWALLREQIADGATLVLTTQYLEEADNLADDIVVLDHGRVTAHGTASELKAGLGGERVEITFTTPEELDPAAAALQDLADGPSERAELTLSTPLRPGVRLAEVLRALDAAGVEAMDVHRVKPSLDDVFLALTDARLEVAA